MPLTLKLANTAHISIRNVTHASNNHLDPTHINVIDREELVCLDLYGLKTKKTS